MSQSKISFRTLTVREITDKLRELLDIMADAELRDDEPGQWADAYVRFTKLVLRERQNLFQKSVLHNIGKKRRVHLENYYWQVINAHSN